jgi:hypothetical protein
MSPSAGRRTQVSPVAVVRAVWGLLLLTLARPALERVLSRPPTPSETLVARLLGAREAVQVAVVTAAPRTATAARVVDLTHLVSMLLLAALDRPRRRAALLSASVTGALAATSMPLRRPS